MDKDQLYEYYIESKKSWSEELDKGERKYLLQGTMWLVEGSPTGVGWQKFRLLYTLLNEKGIEVFGTSYTEVELDDWPQSSPYKDW